MRVLRRTAIATIASAALVLVACGAPPDKEMQQAEGAIAAARAAGAEQYASEEFSAAVDALKRAQTAVSDRDYRLALNNALDSRERAENAAKLGSDSKAVARANAQRSLTELEASVAPVQLRLKALEAARVPARQLAGARRAIAAAQRGVQEARTAFDKGDYPAVDASASAATAQLSAATRSLEQVRTPTPRRRR